MFINQWTSVGDDFVMETEHGRFRVYRLGDKWAATRDDSPIMKGQRRVLLATSEAMRTEVDARLARVRKAR